MITVIREKNRFGRIAGGSTTMLVDTRVVRRYSNLQFSDDFYNGEQPICGLHAGAIQGTKGSITSQEL